MICSFMKLSIDIEWSIWKYSTLKCLMYICTYTYMFCTNVLGFVCFDYKNCSVHDNNWALYIIEGIFLKLQWCFLTIRSNYWFVNWQNHLTYVITVVTGTYKTNNGILPFVHSWCFDRCAIKCYFRKYYINWVPCREQQNVFRLKWTLYLDLEMS